MREIKFRGWNKYDNVMIPWDKMKFDKDIQEEEICFYEDDFGDGSSFTGGADIEAMQYTGLKDNNGTEIYDRDVVQIKGHPFEGHIKIDGNYEVYYNEVMELCCGSFLLHRELPYVTVVGNKFENPELLNN